MRLLHRHILQSTAGPMLFGFFVVTFVLIIDSLYRYITLFVSKGVPFTMASEVLFLSLGHTFALSIPMSVLIGVLMGIGQLTADNEITALKANGVGLLSILRPLLFGGAVVALGLCAYNHFVLPHSNHRLATLLYNIHHTRPMMEISPQQFSDITPDVTIFVKEKDDKTNRIEDVIIIERDGPGDDSPTMTTAAWGTIVPLHEQDAMRLELHDGEIHEMPPDDPSRYTLTRFEGHNLLLRDVERDFDKRDKKSKSDREMDLGELLDHANRQREGQHQALERQRALALGIIDKQWRALAPDTTAQRHRAPTMQRRKVLLRETRNALERDIRSIEFQVNVFNSQKARENRFMVEFHKKLALPFACLVFVLLGLPLAVTTSRSGKGVSVGLALALFMIYYQFLLGGETLADRGKLDPALSMWLANIVLTAAGIPMLMYTIRESSLFSFSLRPPQDDGDEEGGGRT